MCCLMLLISITAIAVGVDVYCCLFSVGGAAVGGVGGAVAVATVAVGGAVAVVFLFFCSL